MNKEALAKLAYDINRVFSLAVGDDVKPYDKNQKEATLAGIEAYEKNPNITPKASHEAWLKKKKEDGWVYGKDKDAVKKTHPNIKPYEQLSKYQKAKDDIFLAVMKAKY